VIPSVWHDNYPVVALEAMAAGCPAIASAVGGLPEMIDDGVTGLLVQPGDPSSLAAAMRLVQSDHKLAATLGCAARTIVTDRNGVERHLASLVDVYTSATTASLRA
jgi:glycosyltransferase involved in cell wall biosynthesis